MSKRDSLGSAINAAVSKYLGFNTEMAGMTGRTVREREICLDKLNRINKLVDQAKTVKAKYTTQQWDAAIIFGIGETGVSECDLQLVSLCLKIASNLWLSDLWKES